MQQDRLKEILEKLSTGLQELLNERIAGLYLYGSQARGEARPDSDIDVLVVIQGDYDYFGLIQETGQLTSSLSLEYDTVIALAFVSTGSFEHRHTPFLMSVRHEAVPV